MQLFTCLVASVVAMVTAAPIVNDDKLINTVDNDGLDRAKRAQELVYFGNQQNRPRPPTKKSDPSLALEIPNSDAAVPQGEEDDGSLVVAHEETPVSADLESRIEAAQEGGNQKAEIDDAMESAMHAAVSSALDEPKAETGDDSQNSGETIENESSDEAPSTDEAVDNENDDEENAADEVVEGDDVEKELQEATTSEGEGHGETEASAESSDETASGVDEESSPETASSEGQNDEVQDFLNELQNQDVSENNFGGSSEAGPNMNDYYKNMYQYNVVPARYPEEQDAYPSYPYLPIYYRRRRSSPHFRSNQKLAFTNHRRTRRIKRDLFDDLALSDFSDSYQGDSDNYLPLSEEELEYFYSKLLPYLAEAYAEDNEDEENNRYDDALDSLRPYSLLEELEPEEEQVYEPQLPIYSERPYGELELSAPMQSEYPIEKRDIMDYYAAPQRKRYFFPFSDEPETHWGAFVPEKRNYDEAIHRLQRLAMALSDEPGPYYSELLGGYKKK